MVALYFVASIATALTVFFGYATLPRLRTPVQFADVVGLAMFTVTGTSKALGTGAPWYAAASVGMINAVGGGMVVETMLRRTPTVLRKDICRATSRRRAAPMSTGELCSLPPPASAQVAGPRGMPALARQQRGRLPDLGGGPGDR